MNQVLMEALELLNKKKDISHLLERMRKYSIIHEQPENVRTIVINTVCEFFKTDYFTLLNNFKSRKRENLIIQQTVCYFLKKKVIGMSWSAIGGVFRKDHATAIHSVRVIKNLFDTDKDIRRNIQDLEKQIDERLKILSDGGSDEDHN